MHAFEDGDYDGFIVWADARDDDRVALDITITAGARKGDVVSVSARALHGEPVALVGLPCTLRVQDGVPHVEIE